MTLHSAELADHDVGRLQVAVDHPVLVSAADGLAHLFEDRHEQARVGRGVGAVAGLNLTSFIDYGHISAADLKAVATVLGLPTGSRSNKGLQGDIWDFVHRLALPTVQRSLGTSLPENRWPLVGGGRPPRISLAAAGTDRLGPPLAAVAGDRPA